MSARAQVLFWSLLLILLGLGLSLYKSLWLGFPLLPGDTRTVWTVEARVNFTAYGQPIRASLALPHAQGSMRLLNETFSASGYGFQQETVAGQTRAVWSQRQARGPQSLFYKLSVYRDTQAGEQPPSLPPVIRRPDIGAVQQDAVRLAANGLLSQAWAQSADTDTLTRQLLLRLQDARNPDTRILRDYYGDRGTVAIAIDLLALSDIAAHTVRGITLEDNRRQLSAQELLEVHVDGRWQVYDPASGQTGLPENFFIWQRGGVSLLDISGGRDSQVSFSVIANTVSARTVALQQGETDSVALLDFSIYTLPIEQQSVFKLILLVPIGSLMVILFRVFVGVRTAGTFMPVLLALAFIQTQLIAGLVIFLLILAIGLGVRAYLSRLNLLLVARIAAVVVVVVILMAAISVLSYKLQIEQALTVVFFPMIILAWTIERMSILWEEDGAREVAIQVAGSLLVATAAFFVMTNRHVEHWSFNFPELMLAVLGTTLLLGQYSGYRLSELLRFRDFRSAGQ